MPFQDSKHMSAMKRLSDAWNKLCDLNEMAKEYGIIDIFQDNGAKILQQLVIMNFSNLPGREGNDAIDANGVEWEMKSINIDTSASGFSTNHHTNQTIIDKYRQVPWSFAIYNDIELLEIYVLTPEQMEPMYQHWEEKLKTMSHLNNPKIPIKFVRDHGTLVYSGGTLFLDPSEVTRES